MNARPHSCLIGSLMEGAKVGVSGQLIGFRFPVIRNGNIQYTTFSGGGFQLHFPVKRATRVRILFNPSPSRTDWVSKPLPLSTIVRKIDSASVCKRIEIWVAPECRIILLIFSWMIRKRLSFRFSGITSSSKWDRLNLILNLWDRRSCHKDPVSIRPVQDHPG